MLKVLNWCAELKSYSPFKFEDVELHALVDKDSSETLKQLSEALEVDYGTISKRLHVIGKIQKEGK